MSGLTASHTSKWIMRRRVLAVMAMLVFATVLVPSAFGATAQLSGTVSAGGALDTTSFNVSSPGPISATIQWSNTSAVLTLALVDPSGVQVALDTSTHNPKTLPFNATTTGTWKVRVKAKT